MSERQVEVRRLTSVELLDAAVWREIGSEEPQPSAAFLEALSALIGRWLLSRSTAPEMDAVTILCRTRGFIARRWLPRRIRYRLGARGERSDRVTGRDPRLEPP